MKKIGVVLSGCGVYDGTEIHEAVLTLLPLPAAARRLSASRRINHKRMLLIT